jgi:O-antigen/teichoic acid export membrane protein
VTEASEVGDADPVDVGGDLEGHLEERLVERVETDRPGRPRPQPGAELARQGIRGSALLLVGRLISVAANFAFQVLIVRYLSVTDYGAFAYALAMITLAQTVVTLGLDRSIPRFVAIYDEQGARDRMFGTIVFATGSMVVLGTVLVAGAWLLEPNLGAIVEEPATRHILVIMLALAPIQALDDAIVSLLAVFAKARSIFLRRYVLAPVLRIGIALALIGLGASVDFLAVGYLAAGIVGLIVNVVILRTSLIRGGRLAGFGLRTLTFPIRDVLAFTVPAMSTDIAAVAINVLGVAILERTAGSDDVAAFRVIQPAAILNQLVMTSFAILFTPLASRLVARGDRAGLQTLYWQTATWLAVISFPIFALTFSLAEPLTVALYEHRYAGSGPFLAALAFAYYFNAALGFNGQTLKVAGHLRQVVSVSVITLVANVVLNVLLVPPFGALGATSAMAATLILFNVLKQVALTRATGVSLLEPSTIPVYVSIACAAVAVLAINAWLSPGFIVDIVVAGVASLAVLLFNHDRLAANEMFPELQRLPLYRRIFGT